MEEGTANERAMIAILFFIDLSFFVGGQISLLVPLVQGTHGSFLFERSALQPPNCQFIGPQVLFLPHCQI